MTSRGVIYVTKMKKNFVYNTLSDIMHIDSNGLMQERVQTVEFTKHTKGTGEIKHTRQGLSHMLISRRKRPN